MNKSQKWLLDNGYNDLVLNDSPKVTDWNELKYVSDIMEMYTIELEDMLISCLPYITDSYDDETISNEGHSHARKLEQRIRTHLA